MNHISRIQSGIKIINFAELLAIVFALCAALCYQIIFKELPCPLCKLQRFGFFSMALGLLLNMRYGFRVQHYSIILLSGLFTGFVALRMIAIFIVPGSGSYGSPFLGLHFYTWAYILSTAIVVVTALVLCVHQDDTTNNMRTRWHKLTHGMFLIVMTLLFINIISILFQCGLHECLAPAS